MFSRMKRWILWLSIGHIAYTIGERPCEGERLMHRSISTELQSDVLIPCNFNTTLLGSDKSADIAVIWRQVNTTAHGLVEVMLRGEVKFWDSKNNRIKAFPKLSESGNFSIVLQKVQPYDLSLYRCELFNGTCRTVYQDIQLELMYRNFFLKNWPFIAGGAGGAFILLMILMCIINFFHSNSSDTRIYANSKFETRKKECIEEKHCYSQHAAKVQKKTSKPENQSNIYANSDKEPGDIYANQPHGLTVY